MLIRKLSLGNFKVSRAKLQMLKALQFHRSFKTSDFLGSFHSMLAQRHQAIKMQTLISVKWWIGEEESKVKRWPLANIWNLNPVSQQRSQIQLRVVTSLDWTTIRSHRMKILILNLIQRAKRLLTAAMALLLLVCRSLMKEEKKKNCKTNQMKNLKAAVSFTLNAQLNLDVSLITRQLSNSFNVSKQDKMTSKRNLLSLAMRKEFILQKDRNLRVSSKKSDRERWRC